MKRKLTAVDLFAGGGGLTLGLRAAGFIVCGAVEIEHEAAATFRANHPSTVLFEEDIQVVSGKQLIETSPTGSVDLLAGCPPCQGFSQLTAKHRRTDPRNALVGEFSRLIGEIQPTVFMLENVPGLKLKGEELLASLVRSAETGGYKISSHVLQVADYGVPQHRRRLVVIGSRLGKLDPPLPSHSGVGSSRWITVKQALSGLQLGQPCTLQRANRIGGPQTVNWHVIRGLSELTKQRLKATKAGTSRAGLPLRLRPRCHRQSNQGFTNVYGRMAWGKPAPTITGGFATLSKGRFGHPSLLRTISVREAAILQSFPKQYQFATNYMEAVCAIVGNALPPRFAEALAAHCFKHLSDYE